MTRIIKTKRGPRRLAECANDPCKYETREETLRRFEQMIKTCTSVVSNMTTSWCCTAANQAIIDQYHQKIAKTKTSLTRLTGE